MNPRKGNVNAGDEKKVARFEKKISELKRDVGNKKKWKFEANKPSKQEMSSDIFELKNNFGGYWCQGEECTCIRSHWVIHSSKSNCWECMHDPCAYRPPLVWDVKENVYFRFFLSCDGKTKKNV